MNQVKLGIIGLGNMGSGHCNNILAGLTPEIKLTAAADLRPSRRDWAKETLPDDVVLFENGEQLIESGLCDAVIIATPHYEHPRLAILAFEHGLHVMSEKPAGVYTKQVREMNEAAIRSGKVFGMMFNQRTNCVYRKMHEMVQSGKYGQIKRVNWIITDWYRTQAYYNSGGWRATWDGEGGGVLLNQCPHHLDLFQWFFGLPVKVRSSVSIGKYHDIEVEDDVNTYCKFADGSTGNFITSTGEFPGTNRLEIMGTRGRMVFEDGVIRFRRTEEDVNHFCRTTPESFPSMTTWDIEVPYKKDSGNQHQNVVAAFVKAVLDPKAKLVADGEEGIRSVEFGNAMLYSGLKHEDVAIPMDTAKYDAMLQELIKNSKFVKKEAKAAVVNMSNSY